MGRGGEGGTRSQEHYIIAGMESEGKDMSQWADCAWLSLSLSLFLALVSLAEVVVKPLTLKSLQLGM